MSLSEVALSNYWHYTWYSDDQVCMLNAKYSDKEQLCPLFKGQFFYHDGHLSISASLLQLLQLPFAYLAVQ
jgi:hypothetical protein